MIKRYRETGLRVPRKTRSGCERIANRLRKWVEEEYGWPTTPFPAVALVEHWGSVAGEGNEYPGYDVIPDEDIPGAAGEYRPHQNLLVFSKTTWDGASDGHPEHVENVVHEICHYILGHPPISHARSYAGDPYDRLLAEEDSERQVEWASDILLMPAIVVRQNMGYGDLMKLCGVTQATAIRRMQDLARKEARKKKGAS